MSAAKQSFTSRWRSSPFGWAANPTHVSPLVGHLVAVASTVLTLLLLIEFGPTIGSDPVLIALVVPITIASFVGGFWPGLTATIVAVLGANYFLLTPLYDLRIASTRSQVDEIILVITGLTICVLNERTLRSSRAAEAAEMGLAESEQTFRTMANSIPLLAWMAEPDGNIFWYNARWYEYTGKREEDMLGWGWQSVHHPDRLPEVFAKWELAITRGEEFEMEFPLMGSDGTYRDFLTRAFPLQDNSGQVQRWFGTNTDVDDIHRRAAAELEHGDWKSSGHFRAVLVNAMDAIVTIDVNQNIVFFNVAAEAMFGMSAEDAIGQPLVTLIPEASRESHGKQVQLFRDTSVTGRKMGALGEVSGRRRNGETFRIEAGLSQATVGGEWLATVILRDITERLASEDARKRAEEQSYRAQRMDSIGHLAGGIAHDLNNVFQPISLAVAVLEEAGLDDDARTMVELIESSAQRGADMVRQILSFARGDSGDKKLLDVSNLLGDVEKVIRETFVKKYDIAFEVAAEPWPVSGDSTQLHQVLLNLCINARDAMPEGGRLLVRAQNLWVDGFNSPSDIGIPDGPFVLISVTDTGTGMDAATIQAIFDPFFTTKPISEGTGLGLSTSLSIVQNHGGFIRVYSEPGRGSNFKVFLPRALAQEAEPSAGEPAQLAHSAQGQGDLVLVVDDDLAILQSVRYSLEKSGYRVEMAAGGAAALSAIKGRADEFAAILTDIHMPGMDGCALMEILQREHAGLPVLAMSGLADARASDDFKSLGARAFIAKPFSAELLRQTLQRVLQQVPVE